jgi:hypothetical protein
MWSEAQLRGELELIKRRGGGDREVEEEEEEGDWRGEEEARWW